MRLFDIPAGTRITVTSSHINLVMRDINARGVVALNVTYDCTATDEYIMDGETRRRMFSDTSVDFL